jgi:hypothetical protein
MNLSFSLVQHPVFASYGRAVNTTHNSGTTVNAAPGFAGFLILVIFPAFCDDLK